MDTHHPTVWSAEVVLKFKMGHNLACVPSKEGPKRRSCNKVRHYINTHATRAVTYSIAYETREFNAAFTKDLQ